MTTTTTTARRPMPWDVMGSALTPADTTSVAAAMKASGLDYQVESREARSGSVLAANSPTDQALPRRPISAPDFRALVRPMPDGSERVLGFTKTRYTPIQNQDAFSVADYLVKEFGAKIIGAADFRDGTRSLLALKLDSLNLAGEDRVDLDLLIVNDHAGNAALTFALTPMRVACTNALPAALKNAERVWKVSHTPNAAKRMELAHQAILKAASYRDAFQEKAEQMLETPMVDAEFAKMVARLYPVKKDAEGRRAENMRDIQAQLRTAWLTSPTIQGIKGTRWAGYNVVTEYLDHGRPVRGEDPSVSRAEGSLDGPYVRQKAALWGMFASA